MGARRGLSSYDGTHTKRAHAPLERYLSACFGDEERTARDEERQEGRERKKKESHLSAYGNCTLREAGVNNKLRPLNALGGKAGAALGRKHKIAPSTFFFHGVLPDCRMSFLAMSSHVIFCSS